MKPAPLLPRSLSSVALLSSCKLFSSRCSATALVLLLLAVMIGVSGCGSNASLGTTFRPNPLTSPTPIPKAATSVAQFQPSVKWGGRTLAVAVSPLNTAVAIAASESGGLFITNDTGATWSHIDSLPPFRMSDVKFAPGNSLIVIATSWADSRTTNGGGIWRSTDGGVTWQKPATAEPACTSRANTWGIAFVSEGSDVFVGTDCGVAVSHDQGATWTHVGLSRTWSIATSFGGIVDTCSDDGHHRSTDSGATFGAADPIGPAGSIQTCSGVAVHGIAASPFESNVLFAVNVGPVLAAPNACSSTSAVRLQLLSESDDGGVTWTQIGQACQSRPPWVALHPSTDGITNHFDIYFSGGLDTRRTTCTGFGGPGLRCATALPTSPNVNVDHADHNGMAFAPFGTNCAQFIVSDGGVHKTSDCGANFTITGAGAGGYNALQLYEVDGQVHPDHTDLYMGTQDNDIWASGDDGATWPANICCEGFFFQVPHSSANDSGQTVTGVACAGCSNFDTAAHFSGFANWPDPAGAVTGNPFLLEPANYVQFNQPSPPSNTLNITTNTGSSWSTVTTISQSLSGRPWVSGPAANATVFQGITKPGNLVGLLKVTGVGTATPLVSNADAGLVSIGGYCMGFETFVCPTVFGVDPNNPQHIIAADVGTNQMKVSVDGGTTWKVDSALTTLLTNNGEFRFSEPNFGTQAHVIAFDPANSNRILVGTEANGVIASLDGGQTWAKMFASEQATGITSFFFDEVQNNVLASSYGRGLWKLSFVPRATAITYTGQTSEDFHDVAQLSAVLMDVSVSPAAPISGVTLTFSLGAQSCSAQTDANGLAGCTILLNQVPGGYTVNTVFAGNGLLLASSASTPFTITREETTVSYTGDTLIANGQTAHLSGVLLEDGTVPIAGRTIIFTLGTTQTCSAVTDGTGTGQCLISPVAQPLGAGTVTVNFAGDQFYLPSSATANTLMFSFPDHGSFVVGNQSDTGSVTFWDAQWWKLNSLSGGTAPAAFKGFASTLSSEPPTCGGNWSTGPGNSSGPPASIPSFMAVIASSSVVQSGSTISGDTQSIVIVQTAPGYAPNPGHSGSGTVVAVLCPVPPKAASAGVTERASAGAKNPANSALQVIAPAVANSAKTAAQSRTAIAAAATPPQAYLQLVGTVAITGQATVFNGDTVTAFGSNFCSGCGPVTLTIGGHVVASGIAVAGDGTFKATFTIDLMPSRYTVVASQEGSTLTDSAQLVVAIGDKAPAPPPIK
ncbi:MAG TPA: sialidase family protein [Candidatus Angelobacter sp.]|nr:sialidase family protein [Candidatus Angelobacter sp.]